MNFTAHILIFYFLFFSNSHSFTTYINIIGSFLYNYSFLYYSNFFKNLRESVLTSSEDFNVSILHKFFGEFKKGIEQYYYCSTTLWEC